VITWLAGSLQNLWLRLTVSLLIVAWLIYIAWSENRNYRAVTNIVTRQYNALHEDHLRAEIAMKLLASQVLKNTQETHQSTDAIKNLPDVPDPKP
jgi:hypothetical protein